MKIEPVALLLRFLAPAVLLVLAAGCGQTVRPEEAGAHATEPASRLLGEVVSVNQELNYVIAKGRKLPADREQAILYRAGVAVGRLRFAGSRQEPFAAADVLKGRPRVGDQVMRKP